MRQVASHPMLLGGEGGTVLAVTAPAGAGVHWRHERAHTCCLPNRRVPSPREASGEHASRALSAGWLYVCTQTRMYTLLHRKAKWLLQVLSNSTCRMSLEGWWQLDAAASKQTVAEERHPDVAAKTNASLVVVSSSVTSHAKLHARPQLLAPTLPAVPGQPNQAVRPTSETFDHKTRFQNATGRTTTIDI